MESAARILNPALAREHVLPHTANEADNRIAAELQCAVYLMRQDCPADKAPEGKALAGFSRNLGLGCKQSDAQISVP